MKVDFLTFYDIGLKRHVSLPLKYYHWNDDPEKPTVVGSILIEDDMGNKSHLFIKDGKLIKIGKTKEITESEDLESVFLELTNEK